MVIFNSYVRLPEGMYGEDSDDVSNLRSHIYGEVDDISIYEISSNST